MKDVPSTDGMALSMKNSELLKLRLEHKLPDLHTAQIKEALVAKDFPRFAELTIRESNQLHAVCLDTYPPIFYMNQTSKLIANTVKALNQPETIAAYSCDAGFHVFVFTLAENQQRVHDTISEAAGDRLERIICTSVDQEGVTKA